jgi:NAD(P)-dependent dehydrogenase (short-subunit alcohol dehydrogenase family)
MKVGLADRVVIITGAASGIGAAIAHEVAAAGAGALLLTDRDADGLAAMTAEITGMGAAVVADLADPAAPDRIARAAIDQFGRIDGLVNAAGLTTRASLMTGTMADWDGLFAVNARAPYFLMQAAVADMLRRNSPGTIVTIGSINAHCGGPELAIYAATKAALATLTKNAANAHTADRIRINGINLGWVATPSEHNMQAEILGRGPGWLAEESAKMPLGRMVKAEEAARFATYLLSDQSAPMTGTVTDFDQRVMGAPA